MARDGIREVFVTHVVVVVVVVFSHVQRDNATVVKCTIEHKQ